MVRKKNDIRNGIVESKRRPVKGPGPRTVAVVDIFLSAWHRAKLLVVTRYVMLMLMMMMMMMMSVRMVGVMTEEFGM